MTKKKDQPLKIVNIAHNGKEFDPATVTLSEELSAQIIEIMNRPDTRISIEKKQKGKHHE